MLVFVVPLQSPESAKDWNHLSRLVVRAMGSLCGQTSPEFRVILVCNQRPNGFVSHPNLTLIEEPFPIPGADRESRMVDKFRKLQRALIAAREFMPGYLMFCDADDCVSRRLADWCARHPGERGWYFKRGYVHDEGTLFAYGRNQFHLFCGTSAIVACTAAELPETMDVPHGENFFLSHGHPILADTLASAGRPLAPLPFPGTVYITGTGENDSGLTYSSLRSRSLQLQKLFHAHYLTPWFRREFNLRRISAT